MTTTVAVNSASPVPISASAAATARFVSPATIPTTGPLPPHSALALSATTILI